MVTVDEKLFCCISLSRLSASANALLVKVLELPNTTNNTNPLYLSIIVLMVFYRWPKNVRVAPIILDYL